MLSQIFISEGRWYFWSGEIEDSLKIGPYRSREEARSKLAWMCKMLIKAGEERL
jgi:hypothetical protein